MASVIDRPTSFLKSFEEFAQKSQEIQAQAAQFWKQGISGSNKAIEAEKCARLLQSLSRSWGTSDPGANGPTVFFVNQDYEHVCVEELLPKDVPRFTETEWFELGWKGRQKWPDGQAVMGYPVVPFSEVLLCKHPDKDVMLPVLEVYIRDPDTLEGGEGMKSDIMIDLDDLQVIVVNPVTPTDRF